ncbi:MAG TPA: hypothetical protein VEZ44_00590 [bacterium]|nr:hypothetical protein [bacterium]
MKYQEFRAGPTGHATKTESKMIECTLLLSGRAQGRIAGRRVVLSAGQYFVIAPGVVSNIPERILSRRASFLVIKAPSVRGSKTVVEAHGRAPGERTGKTPARRSMASG